MPGMTGATSTPLRGKFGPIVADAAGTITVQEASDVLDCSRFRVCELLTASAGRVLVPTCWRSNPVCRPPRLKQPPQPSPFAKRTLMLGCSRPRAGQPNLRALALSRARPQVNGRENRSHAPRRRDESWHPADRHRHSDGPIAEIADLIVCVLTDGFTAIERTMMQGGGPDRVLEMRRAFQRMMNERHSEMIEQLSRGKCSRSSAKHRSNPTSRSRSS